MYVKLLLHEGKVGQEVRRLYFYNAFGLPVLTTRILSFGSCNYECPYCRRMDTFRLPDGSVIESAEVTYEEIIALFLFGVWVAMKATSKGLRYAQAFWLYPIVHLGFLAYLTGFLTIRMSVFLEQVLMFAMVFWIITKAQRANQT